MKSLQIARYVEYLNTNCALHTLTLFFVFLFHFFLAIIQEPHGTNAYYAVESFDCETDEMNTITKQTMNEIRNG